MLRGITMKRKVSMTIDEDLLSGIDHIQMEKERAGDGRSVSWIINDILKTQTKNYCENFLWKKKNKI